MTENLGVIGVQSKREVLFSPGPSKAEPRGWDEVELMGWRVR